VRVSAFVPDLMDRSKLARIGGDDVEVEVVGSAGALDGGADVVVVDLGRPTALDAVRALRAAGSTARIVGFGSHVERDVLAAAGAAGCDRVLARSAFFADVGAAVRGT
jgi:DNA-binding NarL/FixJ family response regulator